MPADRLLIAVSTIGDRIAHLVLPPATDGVDILILLQAPPAHLADLLPEVTSGHRPDVRLVTLDSTGVAKSRNAALDLADAGHLLFADDDVILDMAGVLRLHGHLGRTPGLDMIAGRLLGPQGPVRARGPHRLRLTNSAHIGTPQLMIRLHRIRARGIRFDTRFGLGEKHPLGDEFIFVSDALKAGLTGLYLPVAVGLHPTPSSGINWSDAHLLPARAAALNRVFGAFVLPFALAFAWRHRQRIGGLGGIARFVAQSLRRP